MASVALSIDPRAARRRLEGLVSRALLRLRLQEALRATVFSVTIVAWLLVPLLLADKLFALKALGFSIWVVWTGLLALCIPYILWRAFSNRIHEQFAAILADERMGLHSRLATALTLDPDDPSGFSEAFYHEAADRLAALNPTKAFPIQLPRMAWLLVPAVAFAAAIFYFVPQRDLAGFVAKAQEKRRAEDLKQNTVKRLEAQLEDLKKDDEKQVAEDSAQFKVNQLVKKAEGIAKELKEGKRDANEAVIALAELKREIGDQKEQMASDGKDLSERLKQLSEKNLNLEENDFTKPISEALQQGDAELAAKEMRKLARKVKNEILNDESKTPEEKAEALKKLQNEIEKLAGALEEEGDMGKDLLEAAKQSMSAAEYQELQEDMKKQLAQQGKDNQSLGEQLEKELNEAAEEMEERQEQEEPELSEEEQEAMEELEGLEEGVEEAMEGLTGQCEGGDQQGGKQGGKESGKQGGKARAGKGKKMTGKKSGQSGQQQGNEGRQGSQNGNNNGNGENNNSNPQPNFAGPNQGGPGAGKRAYRDGDATFKSEMVRGKMQSGAISGLSHFRGQGAKGEAPTQYVQALTAAEQDATSSLELDRIPADSRELVKDYFTKLKQDTGGTIKPAVAPTPNSGPEAPAPAPKPEGEALKE